MSAEVLRPEPVAGGSRRGGGGKLGLLINKLHTFLAVSTEQGGEHSLPGHWSGAMAKEFIEQQQAVARAAEECMQPSISSEAKSSSARSRRKPLVVTKHSGLNESDASSESGTEDVLSVNSSEPDTTCLPKGTVFVLPEPVSNEVRDEFRGPEFRSKRVKQNRDFSDKRRGGSDIERVNCTACGQQVNHFQRDSVYQHPALKVLICKSCFKYYMSDDISKDAEGMDEQCRWCAEGGSLIGCDYCSNAFCKKCVLRNLGRRELSAILEEERKWYCYVCSPEPLMDLVLACDSVLQNLEKIWARKRAGVGGGARGKQRAGRGGAGTLSAAPSRGLCDRMQRVVDMTTSLNRSFVEFMQSERDEEASEEEDVDRARRLTMFRTILQDLRQAHTALQEALDRELYGGKRESRRQRAKPRQRKPRAPRGSGVTKELVVKLTPVPMESSVNPDSNADASSAHAGAADMVEINEQRKEEEKKENVEKMEGRAVGKEGKEEAKVEEKCEATGAAAMEEENTDDEDEEDEGDELEMAEENKRSPRVKTTPRRRRSDTTHANLDEDSDSDEVPAVLLQTATAAMATSEEEGGVDSDGGRADTNQEVRKQCLFGLVKTTPPCQDRTSRKRKLKERSSSSSSSSSSSVAEVTDSGSKVRRSVGLPHKVAKTTVDSESSSSDQEMDSSDSDELDQKIKPLSDVTLMGSGTFQQSSGDEVDMCPAPVVLDEDDVENRYGLDSKCAGQSPPSQSEPPNPIKPPDTHSAAAAAIQTRLKSSHTSGPPLTPTRTRHTRAAASTGLVLRRLNIIAKQILLAEIRANFSSSSDQDSSSDATGVEDETESKKEKGDEDSEPTDDSSDSDEPTKPRPSRHRLLHCPLTPWKPESEDGAKKPAKRRRKKRGKILINKLIVVSSDDEHRESASEESAMSEEASQSEDEDGSVQKQKESVDEGDPQTPHGEDGADGQADTDNETSEECASTQRGRKKIRRILEVQQLAKETQEALREEEERRKRLAERDRQRRQEEESSEQGRDDSEVMIVAETPASRPDPLVLELNDATRECLVQVDTHLLSKLKPHQREGVQFMWDNCCESVAKVKSSPGSGCLLAHYMGLGKTLQVITFLHTVLMCELVELRTALVVCPLNTVLNWKAEFDKWQRGITQNKMEVAELATVKTASSRVNILTSWHRKGGVMIMSYELYRLLTHGDKVKYAKQRENLLTALQDPGPDIVVCDEGHVLKNETTAICKAMRSIRTHRRIILTGTPLQNNLSEYHCMVSFVKQNLLGSLGEFQNRFMNPIQNGQCADSTPTDVRLMKKRVHVLHELLAGCVQRRDYSALTPFLPPKREYVLLIRMTTLQCKLYRHYLQNYTAEGVGVNSLFQDFQTLSLIWTHPWCLQLSEQNRGNKGKGEESTSETTVTGERSEKTKRQIPSERVIEESRDPNTTKTTPEDERSVFNGPPAGWYREFVSGVDAELLEHSGKLTLLLKILHHAEELQDKVLVFSQSLISLDMIETFLELADKAKKEGKASLYKGKKSWVRDKDYYRLDGSTSATARKKWAQEFNRIRNKRCRLFLISTRAGSLGINLVGANRVVVFDASWNPMYDVQSMFRVFRFGQKKSVYIYRFLAQGTMEQKIYERQVAKLSLSSRVVDQQQIQRHFTHSQLSDLYRFQPDSHSKSHPVEPADKVLAKLLQHCGQTIVSFHEHDSLLDHRVEEELSVEERKEAWEEFKLEKTTKTHTQAQPQAPVPDSDELWRKSDHELKMMLYEGRMELQKASQYIKPQSLEVFQQEVRKQHPLLDEEVTKQKTAQVFENFERERQRRLKIYQSKLYSQKKLILKTQQILAKRAELGITALPSTSTSTPTPVRPKPKAVKPPRAPPPPPVQPYSDTFFQPLTTSTPQEKNVTEDIIVL
ncbi:transcriptional regulator ATRX-like isoform X2 [Hemibagrus wyckioides]|uniref:transcriptional regulator ATRX-like isoform X2 n=1 Tax=Hemibagrus wyckioides TaxID=337641 RepID=UPI00266B8A40|nr:transcriptional regulator ATRX-like isoform X2 [Hemibagrus wyckioides]